MWLLATKHFPRSTSFSKNLGAIAFCGRNCLQNTQLLQEWNRIGQETCHQHSHCNVVSVVPSYQHRLPRKWFLSLANFVIASSPPTDTVTMKKMHTQAFEVPPKKPTKRSSQKGWEDDVPFGFWCRGIFREGISFGFPCSKIYISHLIHKSQKWKKSKHSLFQSPPQWHGDKRL